MILIPQKSKGRPSKGEAEFYEAQVYDFCQQIIKINSTLDFSVSSRGWCYLLEEYGLTKGDFDKTQRLVNECRKSGRLPFDICAEDANRKANGVLTTDEKDAKSYMAMLIDHIKNSVAPQYRPFAVWDFQDVYIEMLVEKIDLLGIFEPVCIEYGIPIGNTKGWADLNSRAHLMTRFKEWESKGKRCVLLYCGDHDPGGLNISDAMRKNLEDVSPAVGWRPDDLIIDRFGLNYDFIEDNKLSWIENLETGSGKRLDDPSNAEYKKAYVQNYLQKYGARKVEANALVTRIDAGRELCRDAINKYLNHDSIYEYKAATLGARDELQSIIHKTLK